MINKQTANNTQHEHCTPKKKSWYMSSTFLVGATHEAKNFTLIFFCALFFCFWNCQLKAKTLSFSCGIFALSHRLSLSLFAFSMMMKWLEMAGAIVVTAEKWDDTKMDAIKIGLDRRRPSYIVMSTTIVEWNKKWNFVRSSPARAKLKARSNEISLAFAL